MKTTLLKWICAGILLLPYGTTKSQTSHMKQVHKNRIHINWFHKEGRVYFEMSAPTVGWVTIGFNTSGGTSGAYLLMGRVVRGKVEVVEHYTSSPGNYSPITKFGVAPQVKDINGQQKGQHTTIQFSLPEEANSNYQRNLSKGKEYIMLIAYSQEDDFQHHSIMRTSEKVTL